MSVSVRERSQILNIWEQKNLINHKIEFLLQCCIMPNSNILVKCQGTEGIFGKHYKCHSLYFCKMSLSTSYIFKYLWTYFYTEWTKVPRLWFLFKDVAFDHWYRIEGFYFTHARTQVSLHFILRNHRIKLRGEIRFILPCV